MKKPKPMKKPTPSFMPSQMKKTPAKTKPMVPKKKGG